MSSVSCFLNIAFQHAGANIECRMNYFVLQNYLILQKEKNLRQKHF